MKKRIVIIAVIVAGVLIPSSYLVFAPNLHSRREIPPYQSSDFVQQLGLQRLGGNLHFVYYTVYNIVADIFDPPRARSSHPDEDFPLPPKPNPAGQESEKSELRKFEMKK